MKFGKKTFEMLLKLPVNLPFFTGFIFSGKFIRKVTIFRWSSLLGNQLQFVYSKKCVSIGKILLQT